MSVTLRPYDHPRDYEAVGRFLIDTFDGSDRIRNWMQPRWEYMHHHPFIAGVQLDTIAVFEDEGRIVDLAVALHLKAFLHNE